MVEIRGRVEEGYGAVADAFRANFEDHDDIGAGFALYVDGRPVVDLTGGTTEPNRASAYDEHTLQLVFSSTKGAAALCAAMLHEDGRLDYEAPMSRYWPEFAAAGKEDLPVSWVLSHRGGLPVVDEAPSYEQVLAVAPIVEVLAGHAPAWELDGSHGYHALTYGWLVGELVRRITGQTLGAYFRAQVADPLGLDFWIGLPETEHSRVAPLVASASRSDPAARALVEQFMGPDTLTGRALSLNGTLSLDGDELVWNRPEVWSSEIPAANGITNAASLARMYAAAIGPVDGIQLMNDDTRRAATTPVTTGGDRCLFMETKFAMGFMCQDDFLPLPGPRSFGHAGAGGSLGFADPDLGIGYGYVMNKMSSSLLGDPRTQGLTDAVVRALD